MHIGLGYNYFTPTPWYYVILDHILEHDLYHLKNKNKIEIHVFTSKTNRTEKAALHPEVDFLYTPINQTRLGANKPFLPTSVEIHLDDEEEGGGTYIENTKNTLAAMANSDLFIMAHSRFSVLPGVINPNCVLHQYTPRIKLKPFEGWVTLQGWNNAPKDVATLKSELRGCLNRTQVFVD